MRADHGDPFAVLGMHHTGTALVVRALLPTADKVELLDALGPLPVRADAAGRQ